MHGKKKRKKKAENGSPRVEKRRLSVERKLPTAKKREKRGQKEGQIQKGGKRKGRAIHFHPRLDFFLIFLCVLRRDCEFAINHAGKKG